MTANAHIRNRLSDLRREFHRYPEPAWREFYTTCRLAEEIERIGVDQLYLGRTAMNPDERLAVPDSAQIAAWRDRARANGASHDLLERLTDCTGAVAVLNRGDGPTVALRVDIDGLLREESTDVTHRPASEGFRSRHGGVMHACGHDAHMAIGLGVLEAVTQSDFSGTFTVFFQPAEEKAGGGRPMAKSEHIEDVDYLFVVHVGLDHPTGEVVAGMIEPLAVSNLIATFREESVHAGRAPNEVRNAIQALGTAVQSVYSIPRHADGTSRVNIGRVEGGTTPNALGEPIEVKAEVRGETTELMGYAKGEFENAVAAAADMHGCDADVTIEGQAPRADSDPELAALVSAAARGHPAVNRVVDETRFGASEDATYLMREVQAHGGLATYAIVGTDHPTGHHTATFDVDEASLPIAVDVLTEAVLSAVSRDVLGRDDVHARSSAVDLE
ncbi:amidohydrolase [Halegenticoccus tardaugens]|uniref:amidohydrolase n=1 Tax=Halegenticoccus tardaugens TaxID=2071624 RepID=UPI00100A4FB9|nr:amidohydrolase [Halegenticoccus tardaugens]